MKTESTASGAALDLAWALYVDRVQQALNDQQAQWRELGKTSVLVLAAPRITFVNTIEQALASATDRGLHQALGPINDAIDNIDNGTDKSAAAKKYRAVIHQLADDVRAMKSASFAVAK